MIDKWFLEDVEHLIKKRKRVVIIDPKAQCQFLLSLLEDKGYTILKTDGSLTEEWQTVKEELFLRHKAETEHKDEPVVFYVTREQDKLSFLFDYCFTHGCFDVSNPTEWLKMKLFANTGLQVQMDNAMLLVACKLGIGKDIAWWKKILQNLQELVNLEDELLPFLHDPEGYLKDKEADIGRLFEEKLFEMLGQPYINKPPKTIADEVVKQLFDGLVCNNITSPLLQLYYRWADSETYRPSLVNYIEAYKLDTSIDPWSAHPEHCFATLDQKALQYLTEHIRQKSNLTEKLEIIKIRLKSIKVKRFVPAWWQDVITLMEFESSPLTTCHTFDKVVVFYAEYFSKVDRAIRNLYAAFLQEKAIIRPLQEYYESLNYDLLQKWFEYRPEYQSEQQGYLISLFKNAKLGTAVIVGDGIRYEIAEYIAQALKQKFKVEKQIMLADMPSETEHNMSALYVGNGEVLPVHKDRERKLTEITGKAINYMDLEALSYGDTADYLVLSYGDIDKAGEKMQQGAIKLFSEFEQVLTDKITQLLNMGYQEVHLITDHGFVLTGILDEADKLPPDATGKKEVHERFIRTTDKQSNSGWFGVKEPYGEYNYVYAAKSHRPFKSKGSYGYSHGGFTPQEIIIPKFTFRKEKAAPSGLEVIISNKKESAEVIGEYFDIKLQADSETTDLFASQRKVQILIYSGSVNTSSSNIITMKSGERQSMEFSFQGKMEIIAVLLDAETREQLDVANIKKSNARDLGGLL